VRGTLHRVRRKKFPLAPRANVDILRRVTRDTPSANQCACDSLVFDPRDHRAERFSVLLWKKILTWAKPTQRRHLRLRSHSRNETYLSRALTQYHSGHLQKCPFHMHFRRVDKIRWSASAKLCMRALHRIDAMRVRAKRDGFCTRVHPPLMGVGVFSVVLV
jgi:hypothetical protein